VKPWGIAFGDETQSIGNSGYGVYTILMACKKVKILFEVFMSGLFLSECLSVLLCGIWFEF